MNIINKDNTDGTSVLIIEDTLSLSNSGSTLSDIESYFLSFSMSDEIEKININKFLKTDYDVCITFTPKSYFNFLKVEVNLYNKSEIKIEHTLIKTLNDDLENQGLRLDNNNDYFKYYKLNESELENLEEVKEKYSKIISKEIENDFVEKIKKLRGLIW